ncbi:MAG: hypothetical protein Roseis2KO_57520 [Roseivirga sp.]
MNILTGKIASVTPSGELSLVGVSCADLLITAIVIDTPETAPYLKPDTTVKLLFKETEVIIGKGIDHQISLRNQVMGTITGLEKGTLLSKVTITTKVGEINSIITTQAANQLGLNIGAEACAMIKTNEIMLSE